MRFFPRTLILLLVAGLLAAGDPIPDTSEEATPPAEATPSPSIILDGIKYSNPEQQGSLTRKTCRQLGISTVPIAYHGGVDWNQDGEITRTDIRQFQKWINRTIPQMQDGIAVMDYEQPWWVELNARELEPGRLKEILAVYSKGLTEAQTIRPALFWGYWGLPSMRNVSAGWEEQELDIRPLLMQQGAIYPAAYDCTPGDNADEFERYVERSIRYIQGRRPAYVFMNIRYCGQQGDRTMFIPTEEILLNAEAVLRATWTSPDGTVHRAAGIILWDAYTWSDEADWPALDRRISDIFTRLHVLADAMRRPGTEEPPAPSPAQSPPASGAGQGDEP